MYYADCKSFLDPTVFYRKKVGPAVSIASGWCVLRVDADEHVVYVKTMCGEQPIYYERCLLAPGTVVDWPMRVGAKSPSCLLRKI